MPRFWEPGRPWPPYPLLGRHPVACHDAGRAVGRRRSLRVPLDAFRAIRTRVRRDVITSGMVRFGDVLVYDHRDQQFVIAARARDPSLGEPVGPIANRARWRTAVSAAPLLVSMRRALRRAGVVLDGEDDRMVAKSAYLYAAYRRAITVERPAGIVVSGDAIRGRRLLAIAAADAGLPPLLVLHDLDHRSVQPSVGAFSLPAAFAGVRTLGVLAHDVHDACAMEPLPQFVALFPVERVLPDPSRTCAGILLSAYAPIDGSLAAAARLLRLPGITKVLIRRHPRDARPGWPADPPSGVEFADPGEPMGAFGQQILFVACDTSSSSVAVAARRGIPCVTLDGLTPEGKPDALALHRISDDDTDVARLVAAGRIEVTRAQECTAAVHPPVIPFDDALRRVGLP